MISQQKMRFSKTDLRKSFAKNKLAFLTILLFIRKSKYALLDTIVLVNNVKILFQICHKKET